jgi:phage gp46-like protein
MDLALTYDPTTQVFDLSQEGSDLATDDTLASAVLMSLFCDRLAEDYEVGSGEDRRGWWADTFADVPHKTGSRLWLLERNKQLPSIVQRAKLYCEEALAWLVEDKLCTAVVVTAFAAAPGYLSAIVKLELNGQSRSLRIEFDQTRQLWALSGEGK